MDVEIVWMFVGGFFNDFFVVDDELVWVLIKIVCCVFVVNLDEDVFEDEFVYFLVDGKVFEIYLLFDMVFGLLFENFFMDIGDVLYLNIVKFFDV